MIYLDNGATSFPKAPRVGEEMKNCIENYAVNIGRGAYNVANMAEDKVLEGRVLLNNFFNGDSPLSIIYTSNATEALNIAILGILKSGDHVISTAAEHNSVLRPLKHLEGLGVECTILPISDFSGKIDFELLKSKIKKNTKLIVVNHVSNVLGTFQDIKAIGELCKEKSIIFMVDASQSAGKVKIDIKENNIQLLALPGHKGLLGPQGTGILYVAPEIYDEINSFKFGGTGSNSLDVSQPNIFPDKLESGTLNIPSIAGLCEGIKFINKESIDRIYKKEEELLNYLIEELSKLDYVKIYGDKKEKRAGLLSINLDSTDPSKVGYFLNSKDIGVRTGFHCAALIHSCIGTEKTGTVRISPGYFNEIYHIEAFLEAIREFYNKGIR